MDERYVQNLRQFLSSTKLGKLQLALEVRGTSPCRLPAGLVNTMRDYNIIHCVDLSKGESPAYKSEILY
jgi:hypothetical protein